MESVYLSKEMSIKSDLFNSFSKWKKETAASLTFLVFLRSLSFTLKTSFNVKYTYVWVHSQSNMPIFCLNKTHFSALGDPKIAIFVRDDLDPLYFDVNLRTKLADEGKPQYVPGNILNSGF